MTSSPSKALALTWLAKRRIDSSPWLQVKSMTPNSPLSTTSTAPWITSPIHGQVSEGTSMPMTPVRPRARDTARALGT